MAEHRSLPASEHRRHPASLFTRGDVPYGVDAAMDPVQVPPPQTIVNRFPPKPTVKQLTPRDHAVLPSGELCDGLIGRGAFFTHVEH
jgi:hypothetical protein